MQTEGTMRGRYRRDGPVCDGKSIKYDQSLELTMEREAGMVRNRQKSKQTVLKWAKVDAII